MSSLAENASAVARAHHKPRREKMFGEGRLLPLDRNAKARIMVLARALMQRSGEGKHYGVLTAKFVAVLGALLWGFHNAATGRCFPSYERIAEKADCAQRAGLRGDPRAGGRRHPHLGEPDRAHPGVGARPVRPGAEPLARHPHQQRLHVRRSATASAAAISSKSEFPTGTEGQELLSCAGRALDPENMLHRRCCGSEGK